MLEAAKFIPWFPALGAILCGICCLRKSWRVAAAPICILSIAAAFVTSVIVSSHVPEYNPEAISAKIVAGEELGPEQGVVKLFDWISVGSSTTDPGPTPDTDANGEITTEKAPAPDAAPDSTTTLATEHAELQVNMGYFVDTLTILMLFVITGIGTLVAWYAAFYMAGDKGYARFFAAVGLFIFAMTTLVMADNLVLIYLGWEGVGLCSYLVIGFYYDKPSAVAAAKKAFIVNRVGDLGFALGIFLTYMHYDTVSLAEVTAKAGVAQSNADLWIPFLLMLGAFGKSAQIPLYVWLPDAMEGPTPVSALIHAATMVTAGVYMISRLVLVFSPALSPYAMPTVAIIGCLTAFFAATIALCQYDIKRIFAYSTISQLGYMFMGIGVLSTFGGVFHLFTHAFFKALLFLTAGSVMHALAGQLDLRKMGGLRKKMPVTCWLMFAGCLALAGFPFTSGFFSKDLILAETMGRGLGPQGSNLFILLAVVGMFTAFLTSYYTFRLWFRVFLGPEEYEMGDDHGHGKDHASDHASEGTEGGKAEIEVEHHHEPHEMPVLMNLPLVFLAVGAIFAGVLCSGWVEDSIKKSTANVDRIVTAPLGQGESAEDALPYKAFVADENAYVSAALGLLPPDSPQPARALITPVAQHARINIAKDEFLEKDVPEHHHHLFGMELHSAMGLMSGLISIAGILLAGYFHWLERPAADRVAARFPKIVRLLENKYYVDEFYHKLIISPLRLIGELCFAFDRLIIEPLVNLFGFVPRIIGSTVQPTQRGVLQGYGLSMLAGVSLIVLILVWQLTG